jgi:phosphatidylglycerophosphate synthase
MMSLVLICLVILSLVAAILEFACMRDCRIPDNKLSMIGRRLAIAAWLFFSGRFFQLLIDDKPVFWLSAIAFSFLAVANIIRCANRLSLRVEEIGGGVKS